MLRVWESDGSEDGFLGRRNDVVGMEHIRKQDTENACGTWVAFHRYTNQHPRKRTRFASLWLLLRTAPADGFGISRASPASGCKRRARRTRFGRPERCTRFGL